MKCIETVKAAMKKLFLRQGYEYQRGFKDCFDLFEIGLTKEGLYNQGTLLREQERLKDQIQTLKIGLKALQEQKDRVHKNIAAERKSMRGVNKLLNKYQRFVKAQKLRSKFNDFIKAIGG